MRLLEQAVLCMASWLAPRPERAAWLCEWQSEWWYVRRARPREALPFCLGAFADAWWLRRHEGRCPDAPARSRFLSPAVCLVPLAGVAAASFLLALRLPGPRDTLRSSPYPDARRLVILPPMTHAEFLSLPARAFSGRAYYRVTATTVRSARHHAPSLSVAIADENLFRVLGLPVEAGRSSLILSDAAWSKHFGRDPRLPGRMVEVAGRTVRIAGILPADWWRLPGSADGWLLSDGADLRGDAPGHVVARVVDAPPVEPWWGRRWHLSVEGRRYECTSLAPGPAGVHLAVVLLALVAACLRGGRFSFPSGLRAYGFLTVKMALAAVLVFAGTLDLASAGGMTILPHGLLVGYFLGFRWALHDQERRCPVCLRRLSHPVRIGRPSHSFLEWYGTELACAKGHGLLHVPAAPGSSGGAFRWYPLDASWNGLFR